MAETYLPIMYMVSIVILLRTNVMSSHKPLF